MEVQLLSGRTAISRPRLLAAFLLLDALLLWTLKVDTVEHLGERREEGEGRASWGPRCPSPKPGTAGRLPSLAL